MKFTWRMQAWKLLCVANPNLLPARDKLYGICDNFKIAIRPNSCTTRMGSYSGSLANFAAKQVQRLGEAKLTFPKEGKVGTYRKVLQRIEDIIPRLQQFRDSYQHVQWTDNDQKELERYFGPKPK